MQVIWKPQPKQALALSCPADDILFGGAAGGGKSDYLLADYLAGANKWGDAWKGVLFRKSFPQLEELIGRAKKMYCRIGARYCYSGSAGDKMFLFPNGATLKMRYIQSDKDVENYQGQEYTWVGFDEAGQYATSYPVDYMRSRLRSPAGAPTYIRLTANPGGIGHSWIKNRYIDNHDPYRIYKDYDDGGEFITRAYIPSRVEDNQILLANDPKYLARLNSLPKYLARALREGDWTVFAGQVFEEFRIETHVVKPFTLEQGAWYKFCALDWGYSHPYSLGWWAINGDGRMVKYREWYGCEEGAVNTGVKEGPKSLAERAMEMSAGEGANTMVADPAIWQKDTDAPSIAEIFEYAGWNMVKGNNDRVNGLIIFHERLTQKDHNGTPMLTVFPNCKGFIRTIPTLTPDQNHPEDIDTRLEDHVYDESRYAVMSEFAKEPNRAIDTMNRSNEYRRKKEEWNPWFEK